MTPPPTFDVRLARARMLSPMVRELGFERALPFVFEAGQWVSFVLPLAEGEARRAYSIASAPDGSANFEVAVTRVADGPGSTFLHELPVGSTLRAIGPQGFFTRAPRANHPSLFVGTGTGVTPLRSMIRSALAAGETAPLTLLFGVRRESDCLYREELEALEKQHSNFHAYYSISQAGPEWPGRRGYVQTHAEGLWRELEGSGAAGGTAPHVYTCGLERMVSAVRDLLRRQMGVDRKQVHSERYD